MCVCVCVCSSDSYYDTFAGGISAGRLKNKTPLLYHAFLDGTMVLIFFNYSIIFYLVHLLLCL